MIGAFADGFASWRRVLANGGTASGRMVLFINCASEVAGYVARGLPRAEAADALTELAVAHGLVAHAGPDEVQRVIAEAFEIIAREDGRERPDAEVVHLDGRGQGNGFHRAPARPAGPMLKTLAAFVASFSPPAYLVDGILQRGYLYSLTARTNHGKTTLTMLIATCIDRGMPLHGREVLNGTVLFLAGENADDIRARFLVAADYYKFDISKSKVRVIDGVVKLAEAMPAIAAEAAQIDDLVLVIVDTAAAYFPGDETNSNSQQAAYARLLRQLTILRGKPTVLVNCHPVKNATRDNLLPVGGGSFVNEVDGNLTLWADEKQVSLHWQGKFRGPEFEPLPFELVKAESPNVVDAKGRPMPSVVAVPIADAALEAGERKREDDENRVLFVLADNPKASFGRIAQKCDFVIDGREQKGRVQRIIAHLLADKLVLRHRGGKYKISEAGRKEIGLKSEY